METAFRWLKQELTASCFQETSPCASVHEVVFLGQAASSPRFVPSSCPLRWWTGWARPGTGCGIQGSTPDAKLGAVGGHGGALRVRAGAPLPGSDGPLPAPHSPCSKPSLLVTSQPEPEAQGIQYRGARWRRGSGRRQRRLGRLLPARLRPRCSTHRCCLPSRPPPAQTCAAAASSGLWGWPPEQP